MIPLYILKPIVSLSFSILLFFGINVYNSYSQNDKIELNEQRLDEAFSTSDLLKNLDNNKSKSKKPIVIITGSTSGIGFYMASELYRLGLIVIIASRSKNKCDETIKQIKEKYPNGKGELDTFVLDVGDFVSVNNFVDWFKGKYNSLNYLINNAGIHYIQGEDTQVMKNTEILSKQGYDEVFATNYMGHFLLTHQLLPLIKKGRVITIASGLHYGADGSTLHPDPKRKSNRPDAADGENRGFYHRANAYNVSKLAQVLHVQRLKELLREEKREKDIQIVAICPGWVKTNMIPTGPMGKIIYRFAFPTRAAVITPLLAMVDHQLKGGEFLTNYQMPVVQGIIGRKTLALFTKIGLRDIFSAILAIAIALFETLSYGYHKSLPSEESLDKSLAKELYDWTLEELKKTNFIKK
eukprot:gene10919-11902_t